jgi:DNA-binding transcriptional MocR family regulator
MKWVPDLQHRRPPLYQAIADAISDDITAQRLRAGMLMPTHRWLADQLNVHVGTVTRAYSEAKRRGHLIGEVGRGTYVHADTSSINDNDSDTGLIHLTVNQPAIDFENNALNEALEELSGRHRLMSLLDYQRAPGREHHRIAGAKWAARTGVDIEPSCITVTNGAQQALMATMMVLAQPDSLVVTEALNYPGIRRLADLLHIRLHGLEMDEHGVIPDGLRDICLKEPVAAIIVTPTIHNPTASVLPAQRRKALADIAAEFKVPIVEDDSYGHLIEDGPSPIHTFAQYDCYYICGTSKSLAPGLRVGYLSAPAHMVDYIVNAVRTTTWTTASLMAEIASMWIEDGTADRFVNWHRVETAARQKIAQEILNEYTLSAHPASYHLWLNLPSRWRVADFVLTAKARGVDVTPSSAFSIDPNQLPNAVRISLGAPSSREILQTGLEIVAKVLQSRPLAQMVVV